MKYKTTIRITSEAKDRHEALDIVDDYLAGNIRTGVDMKCRTSPACSSAKVTGAIVLSLVIVAAVVVPAQFKSSHSIVRSASGVSAVQPPLKTDKSDVNFKKQWEARQTKEALEYIKR